MSLSEPATLRVGVYSVNGARVRDLGEQSFPVGDTRLTWDGTDNAGNRVPSGVYLVRFDGSTSAVARVITLR